MVTTVGQIADRFAVLTGPVIQPSQVRVIYDDKNWGRAVWRDEDRPIVTTMEEMLDNVGSDFGSGPIVNGIFRRPFMRTNDIEQGEVLFRADRRPGSDVDGDGFDADTFRMTIVDAADLDADGVDVWLNGVRKHIAPEPSGGIVVLEVRTDDDVISFRWSSGIDRRPGMPDHDDGISFTMPCVQVVDLL